MTQQEAEALFNKYRRGETSEGENALIESWYLNETEKSLPVEEQIDYEVKEQRIWARIQGQKRVVKKVKLWPRIAVAAAVAVVIFGAGLWFYSSKYQDTSIKTERIAGVNDIAPGKNGATITLANGKVIRLSDAKSGVVIGANSIKYNDGSFLSPSGRDGVARGGSGSNNPLSPQGGSLPGGERNSMALTATTAKGQTYQFTLPDGTKVWLNADSKLEFPSKFGNVKQRIVKLSGEGYFEVAKVYVKSSTLSKTSTLSPRKGDLSQGERGTRVPFIVQTNNQEVEVLGTHFNINSYSNESSVRTTLVEGSVKVSALSVVPTSLPGGERKGQTPLAPTGRDGRSPERGEGIILKPNQQAVLPSLPQGHLSQGARGVQIQVKEVDPLLAMGWKDGKFRCKNESLESLMRKVGRWYDVEVVYVDADAKQQTFTGILSRFDHVSKLLKRIEMTGLVRFRIEGKKIVVSKGE